LDAEPGTAASEPPAPLPGTEAGVVDGGAPWQLAAASPSRKGVNERNPDSFFMSHLGRRPPASAWYAPDARDDLSDLYEESRPSPVDRAHESD
jgi:hypothetical protein